MEFKFKRKYTSFFITALFLHIGVLMFWLFFPSERLSTQHAKQTITLLLLANIELILIFYIGLFRKKYFAYHDKLIIKRSLFKNISISYKDIKSIKENKSDSILLGFGLRPSFTIYYSRKKVKIRTDNNALLLKVINNEINILKKNNTKQ